MCWTWWCALSLTELCGGMRAVSLSAASARLSPCLQPVLSSSLGSDRGSPVPLGEGTDSTQGQKQFWPFSFLCKFLSLQIIKKAANFEGIRDYIDLNITVLS